MRLREKCRYVANMVQRIEKIDGRKRVSGEGQLLGAQNNIDARQPHDVGPDYARRHLVEKASAAANFEPWAMHRIARYRQKIAV